MTTKNLKKQELLTLKAKIKGLAEGGARCREFIAASKGDKRYRHWTEKRSIGREARYHLIAYGLLRGIPYETIEPNSDKEVLQYLDFEYLAQICRRHAFWLDRSRWTADNVKRLIKTGTMLIPAKVVML